MNIVYLITNGCGSYKIGFTRNLEKRMSHYYSHNPATKLINFVNVQNKTKFQLETELHNELKKMGYKFIINIFDGSATEWITPNETFKKELDKNGLKCFNACKNRIVYKRD